MVSECAEVDAVADGDGGPVAKVAALCGDVNGDKCANVIDMAMVKSKNGAPLPGNERFDVNCDGVINLIDMALAKGSNGRCVVYQ